MLHASASKRCWPGRELNLVGCVGPVLDVRAVRPARDAPPVQEQLESFVGADVNAQRRGGRLKSLAESQQHRLAPADGKVLGVRHLRQICEFGMPDPCCLIDRLHRVDAGVAHVQARRQKDFLDDRCGGVRGESRGRQQNHENREV